MRQRLTGWLTTGMVALVVMSACGGTTAPPAAGTSAPAGTQAAFTGTKTFRLAHADVGLSNTPLLAAVDILRGQGFTIDTVQVGETEVSVQGVVKGEFAISSGSTSGLLIAAQKGGKIKILVDRVANEWTVYAAKPLAKCADLTGKRLAIHSEGAVSTAMVKNWLNTECPTAKPTFLVIPGSENRYKALLAGQIDASPLELADAIAIESEASGRFNLVTSFAQTLPNVHPTTVYGNGDFVEKNPDTVKALVKALLEVHRKIAADPKNLVDIVLKYNPQIEKKTLDKTAQTYVQAKMFDVNGGLTNENLQGTLDFFTKAGVVKEGLKLSDVADLSPLQAVLGEIGRK